MFRTLLDSIPIFYWVFQRLRRAEHRHEVAMRFKRAIRDGRMAPPEWASLGKALGVFEPEQKNG